jgi:hypothetical protein
MWSCEFEAAIARSGRSFVATFPQKHPKSNGSLMAIAVVIEGTQSCVEYCHLQSRKNKPFRPKLSRLDPRKRFT